MPAAISLVRTQPVGILRGGPESDVLNIRWNGCISNEMRERRLGNPLNSVKQPNAVSGHVRDCALTCGKHASDCITKQP